MRLAAIVIGLLLPLSQYVPGGPVFPNATATCTPSTAGLVQTAVALGGGALSVAFPSPNTAGNTIVAYYNIHTGGNPTVSDTNGNSYTNYAVSSSSGVNFNGFWVATSIASGSNTVNISTFGAAGVMIIAEWTGLPTVEASTAIGTVGAPPVSIGPITTTGTNSMVLLGASNFSTSTLPTNSNSWTLVNSGGGTGGLNQGTVLWSCQANLPSTYSNTVNGTGFIYSGLIGLKT